MAYQAKAYTLREESTESGTRYFIRLLEEQGFAPEAAETYCRTFKKELNA